LRRTSPYLPDPVVTPVLTWEGLRDREAAQAVLASPPDYKCYHQAQAARWRDFTGGAVLVVGCNRGEDCAYFVERGAGRVVGVDVMDEIGRNYDDPRVTYVKASAESLPLDGGQFDLVFAYATLEHVPDIRAAFAEMARAAAPGGIVYSAAAPLWCTRAGPHWGAAFDHDPWPHLRLEVEEVVALGATARASGRASDYCDAARLREFLTDPLLFNRRRAHEYLDACVILEDVEILRNEIQMEDQRGFDPAMVRALIAKGYTTFDLFGLTHILIGRRR
jgi:SAM-dependent methyltransferase